jgi:hypothetical protein
MSDKIVNFYDKLGIKVLVLPKTWKKHHMYNKCHTLCLGGTGSGKINALINYISRSSGEFYKIIACSFSTTDEPLYNMLEDTGKIELRNDIEEVPDLEDFDHEHKNKPKLIVFDDFLNLQKKDMKKINKFIIISLVILSCGVLKCILPISSVPSLKFLGACLVPFTV